MPELKPPMYIDPHIHMVSRTTDDYQGMREAGVVAVIEPAFWIGQPRTTSGSFLDYFSTLIGWERFRASQFGIRHYCTMGLNSKEANNEALAEQVLDMLPRFLGTEGVVAVGEIGYDEITTAEEKAFRAQLEMAKEWDMPVMIHTPHRDKNRGTSRSMDVCEEHGISPSKVVIDHNNEETCREVLIVAIGARSPSIRKPRWETCAWWMSSRNTVRNASSSTAAPIGELAIRWLCPRPPVSCLKTESHRRMWI